jgi:hypothetical protein
MYPCWALVPESIRREVVKKEFKPRPDIKPPWVLEDTEEDYNSRFPVCSNGLCPWATAFALSSIEWNDYVEMMYDSPVYEGDREELEVRKQWPTEEIIFDAMQTLGWADDQKLLEWYALHFEGKSRFPEKGYDEGYRETHPKSDSTPLIRVYLLRDIRDFISNNDDGKITDMAEALGVKEVA